MTASLIPMVMDENPALPTLLNLDQTLKKLVRMDILFVSQRKNQTIGACLSRKSIVLVELQAVRKERNHCQSDS